MALVAMGDRSGVTGVRFPHRDDAGWRTGDAIRLELVPEQHVDLPAR
jgi:hypothetical protein